MLSDGIGRGGQAGRATVQRGPEIGLEVGKGRFEKLPAGDDDHVHPATSREVRTQKNLSYQSFSSISSDRVPELSGGDDAESCGAGIVWRHENREKPPFGPERQVEHALEFTPAPDPAILREALGRHRL